MVDAVAGQLPRLCGSQDEISLQACIDNLNDDVLVRKADDEAVFGSIVFVLCLGHKSLSGVVIGFALPPTAVFYLETREVSV